MRSNDWSQRLYLGLRAYFCSGWAFLVPYLVVYLLYAWRGWPVHAAAEGFPVPSLVLVYQTLHVLHLLLAVYCLWSHRWPAAGRWREIVRVLAPWVLLALLFWIPGPYLEYPSDPWEHLARINEWDYVQHVRDHFTWRKSSYFLAYSLVGGMTGPDSVALRLYYTGACLLLSWQYYRLARSAGLEPPAATVFAVLQALLLGNNLFSFHRYYGLSSSLPAQITALALIRTGLEIVLRLRKGAATPAPRWPVSAGVVGILAVLTTFNHVQGLGIAALGLGAVACWALVAWRARSALWLAVAGVLASCAVVRWWPRRPEIDGFFVPEGWFTSWYAFNLFDFGTVTGERTLQMLGVAGLASLVAALLLLRRNHVAAWLTLVPVIALCLPAVAIPFTNVLLDGGGNTITNVRTFHRLLLAMPVGLALVAVTLPWLAVARPEAGVRFGRATLPLAVGLSILGVTLTLPPAHPWHDRTWNALASTPDDLALRHLPAGGDRQASLPHQATMLTPRGMAFAMYAIGDRRLRAAPPDRYLEAYHRPSEQGAGLLAELGNAQDPGSAGGLLVVRPGGFYSPLSLAGQLSAHWNAHHVALDAAGINEFARRALASGWTVRTSGDTMLFLRPAQ